MTREERRQKIERMLAAYAMAAGAALAGGRVAKGEIIYVDLNEQDVFGVGSPDTFDLELNAADGSLIATYTFLHSATSGTSPSTASARVDAGSNYVLQSEGRVYPLYKGSFASNEYGYASGQRVLFSFNSEGSYGYYEWRGADPRFVGLRFNGLDGETLFGWARVSLDFDTLRMTIHDAAFSTVDFQTVVCNVPALVANQPAITSTGGNAVSFALNVVDEDDGTDPTVTRTYLIEGPGHGSLSGTAPNLTYTPEPGFEGTDTFTVRVDTNTVDGFVEGPRRTVSITVTDNPAPEPSRHHGGGGGNGSCAATPAAADPASVAPLGALALGALGLKLLRRRKTA